MSGSRSIGRGGVCKGNGLEAVPIAAIVIRYVKKHRQ
jgi:hypothetical protein